VLWLILRCFNSVLYGSWLTALDSIDALENPSTKVHILYI